jgi:cytochrome c biogenesis protein CcmG/thiol:disulfide interchange protein DsbE
VIFAVPAIALAVVGIFLFRGLFLNPTVIESPMIGQTVPTFSLPVLEDPTRAVATDDLAGRYVLVNFWATWCAGCLQEHDYLMYLSQQGVPIYGVNWKDDPEAAREWLAARGDPFVVSAMEYQGDVAIDFGVYGAPETFLVGPDLTILAKFEGPLSPAVWDREFAPHISAGAGTD